MTSRGKRDAPVTTEVARSSWFAPRRAWRSRRGRRLIVQGALGGVALLVLVYLLDRALALDLGLGFLTTPAGFSLSNEWGTNHQSSASRIDAYVIGIWNTVRLITISIILATLLGVVAGVARLSSNWIVNRLGLVYVETIRNTPLLVQIVFWWGAVFLAMPALEARRTVLGLIWLSNRGIAIPWAVARNDYALPWLALVAVSAGVALWVRARRIAREDATGANTRPNAWALGAFLGLAAVTFLVTGAPYEPTTPSTVVSGANIVSLTGGLVITPQFAAVMIALTSYTGAFIAEIVRGSIQSLPLGQNEAAAALGLSGYQRMTLVILPQALRVMIPALTNQYLNLTKNSSLAVVVGYSELFFVSTVVVNNAGHAVPMFALVIATYQVMSLLISVGMNYLNQRVRLGTQ